MTRTKNNRLSKLFIGAILLIISLAIIYFVHYQIDLKNKENKANEYNAKKYYAIAKDEFKKNNINTSFKYMTTALEYKSDYVPALESLVRLCDYMKKYDEALMYFDKLKRLIDVDTSRTCFAAGDSYFAKGLSEDNNSYFDKAIEYSKKYIKYHQYETSAAELVEEAYETIVLSLNNEGEYQKGIAEANNFINRFPNYPMAYVHRGFSKQCSEDYYWAEQDANKALSLDSTLGDAFRLKGNCIAMKIIKVNDKDKVVFTNYHLRETKTISSYLEQQSKFLDQYLENRGKLNEALLCYDKAIKLETSNMTNAYLWKGITEIALRRKDEARESLIKSGESGSNLAYDLIKANCADN